MSGYYEAYDSDRDVPLWAEYEDDDYDPDEDGPEDEDEMSDIQIHRDEFRWKTMDGRVLALADMNTGHVFNSMKMCFNHLAASWGGEPVWFTKAYEGYRVAAMSDPRQLAWLVCFFVAEIERRGDLPDRYAYPYSQIISQLRPRMIGEAAKLLPSPEDDSRQRPAMAIGGRI